MSIESDESHHLIPEHWKSEDWIKIESLEKQVTEMEDIGKELLRYVESDYTGQLQKDLTGTNLIARAIKAFRKGRQT